MIKIPKKEKLKAIKGLLKPARPDSAYDKRQLAVGIKVELEHTRSKATAKRITKHHLDEHPKYYVELKKMEDKLEKQKKAWEKRKRQDVQKSKYKIVG